MIVTTRRVDDAHGVVDRRHRDTRAEKACLVSASLSTPIRLEAEIVEQPGSGERTATVEAA